jgi:alkanesulfonate monooxygenase SsuD/methylene tetrahydromethanopterin reductase-like flavin-dependent oxidoreductase (luciferase family)
VSPTPDVAAEITSDVRRRAVAHGRDADEIRFVVCLSFVVGSSEEEARRKAEDIGAYLSTDGLLAHISRDVGIDFGDLEPDTPLTEVRTEAIQSIVQVLLDGATGDSVPCVADLAYYLSGQNRLIGTPEQIADQLASWQAAGVDGVNVLFTTLPGSLDEFVEHVVPELQRRGMAQREYAPGTLREKIFGNGPRLPASHPGSAYRRPSRPSESEAPGPRDGRAAASVKRKPRKEQG